MKLTSALAVAALSAALAAGLAAPVASASPAPTDRRASTYQPTLKARPAALEAGTKLVLSGKVKPATKGGTVIVQKKLGEGNPWNKEATLTMSRKGAFSYVDRPRTPGTRFYRVVVPKAGKVKSGRSKPVEVTVYQWQSLDMVDIRQNSSTYLTSSVSINAKSYGPAFVGANYQNEGFVDWNLDRKCLKLRARLANSDDSDDLATAGITLVGDGDTIYSKSFALAKSELRTFDLTGVFRLGFHWTSTNPDGTVEDQSGASATLAEPEVYCAF